LTFIAGVYGMNFHPEASPLNMPELNWYWGYPFFWFVIIVVAMVMVLYFRRLGWILTSWPQKRVDRRQQRRPEDVPTPPHP